MNSELFLLYVVILGNTLYLQMHVPQILKLSFGLIPNIIIFSALGLFLLRHIYRYAELVFMNKYKKPFFLNFIVTSDTLSTEQINILKNQFWFYNRINREEQKIFRYRVGRFIQNKSFHGREGFVITEEVKVLIAATSVMLTFGFRDFLLSIIHTVLVYPSAFKSKLSANVHKGEVNPNFGVIAFSWDDFKFGYDNKNDNLNLGIHEFGHAIHLNSYKNKDISSQLFIQSFNDLKRYLKSNESKRQQLTSTRYFREYAYTNEFEFVAVLIECFIETPVEFKSNFPVIYNYVKQMLNFNFAGY